MMRLATIALTAITTTAAAAQPQLVCDLTPVLSGAVEGDRLRTYDLVRENAEPVRITFSVMDPKAGTARMIVGEGASGDLDMAMTSEPGVITFLAEKSQASKMPVTVQTKAPPSPQGGPPSCRSTAGQRATSPCGPLAVPVGFE